MNTRRIYLPLPVTLSRLLGKLGSGPQNMSVFIEKLKEVNMND
jgi:hypothetical protein